MSKWTDALARAYAETGARPEPPRPPVDTDRWPDNVWGDGPVSDEERALFAANGYRYLRFAPETNGVRLADIATEFEWSDMLTPNEENSRVVFGVHAFMSHTGRYRRYGQVRNWMLPRGTTFELWWK